MPSPGPRAGSQVPEMSWRGAGPGTRRSPGPSRCRVLVPGHDSQGAEYLHLNQPPRGVEQTAGEHDVPGELPVVLGNQRKTMRRRNGLPQGIDQIGRQFRADEFSRG